VRDIAVIGGGRGGKQQLSLVDKRLTTVDPNLSPWSYTIKSSYLNSSYPLLLFTSHNFSKVTFTFLNTNLSLNMSASTDTGKRVAQDEGGRRTGGLVNVQPPRPDDLQPRYAHQIEEDAQNPAAHGWYASMIHGLGSIIGCMGAVPCCFCCPNPFKPIDQGEVGLVSKFGR